MNIPLAKASRSRFRYRRFGVYDLTYEDAALPPFASRIYSLLDGLGAIYKEMPYVRRQVVDAIKLAPVEFIAYMVTTIWQGMYSAINLYWLSTLFEKVCRFRPSRKLCFLYSQQLGDGFVDGALPPEVYMSLAASWLSCAMVNVAAERT